SCSLMLLLPCSRNDCLSAGHSSRDSREDFPFLPTRRAAEKFPQQPWELSLEEECFNQYATQRHRRHHMQEREVSIMRRPDRKRNRPCRPKFLLVLVLLTVLMPFPTFAMERN